MLWLLFGRDRVFYPLSSMVSYSTTNEPRRPMREENNAPHEHVGRRIHHAIQVRQI